MRRQLPANVLEKLAQPRPAVPASEMEEIARDDTVKPSVPNSGYVSEFAAATQRGREQITSDAGKSGEKLFPPARQVV
ncbi:MAG: hypothetical protein ABSG87_10410, partial [Verrucomicrobiota bacterium]